MLSDRDIAARGMVEPFVEDCLQPASYDVHLSPRLVDPFDRTREGDIQGKDKNEPYFVLPPHELWLGETAERFDIPPDLAAKVEGRSSWGRLGLMTHITAGFVDPGFTGTITLELYNVGRHPLRLPVTPPGDAARLKNVEPIAQVGFFRLASRCAMPYRVRGHYAGQDGPTVSRLSGFVER